ncbi:MAG: alpha/beta hydrolase [Polyangiaceae bacterium]
MKQGICKLAMIGALALATGCVRSYNREPALAFQDVSYSSTAGCAWPAGTLRLPGVEAKHKLETPLHVAYIERNPAGDVPVIFVHGLGSSLKFWRYQIDTFAEKGYRVIAVDLPGYGKSDKPASFPYSMEAMADVVAEVASALHADKPIVIGHSMGGQTGLSYAIRYPDKLRALVLTSPAGFEPFSVREKEWFRRVFSTRLIKKATEYQIWGSVRSQNFQKWKPEYEWLIEDRVRLAKSPEFDAYAYANVRTVDGLLNDDFVRGSLDKITAPTLIVFGEDDSLIPNPFLHGGNAKDLMEVGHKGIKGSELVPLAGCGHMIQMDCSVEYNAAVEKFIAAHK